MDENEEIPFPGSLKYSYVNNRSIIEPYTIYRNVTGNKLKITMRIRRVKVMLTVGLQESGGSGRRGFQKVSPLAELAQASGFLFPPHFEQSTESGF